MRQHSREGIHLGTGKTHSIFYSATDFLKFFSFARSLYYPILCSVVAAASLVDVPVQEEMGSISTVITLKEQ